MLPANCFEQFKILRVSRADLQHHSGWVAEFIKTIIDFLNMHFMGYFHGNNFYSIFSCQFKNVWKTFHAVSLERIRICTRLISSHTCAYLSIFLQSPHHLLYIFFVVHCTQSGKDIEVSLIKMNSIVFKIDGTGLL